MRVASTAARPVGRHLARLGEPLGRGQHGGQRHPDEAPAVVELAAGLDDAVRQGQLLDPGREGEVEQFGDLGPDLAGVGVDGVAPHEHEVEGALAAERGGQRRRGGQGVGPGEGGVGDEHALVGSPRQRLAQGVLGRGRPQGEDGARAADFAGELDALAHRPPAVGVHLELDAVALEAPVGSSSISSTRGTCFTSTATLIAALARAAPWAQTTDEGG